MLNKGIIEALVTRTLNVFVSEIAFKGEMKTDTKTVEFAYKSGRGLLNCLPLKFYNLMLKLLVNW